MVTITYDHGARRRSYELIADAFGVTPPRGRPRCMPAGGSVPRPPSRLARLRLARLLRARRARAASAAGDPVVRARDRRARARLRRHLPARHRAPERAGRARGAGARRAARARRSATCSPPTPTASRRWARSPPPATPRSTTAAGTRPRCAARSARRSRRRGCSAPTPTTAAALAALRAGGLRAAFGSDGKSIQVGLAAATGVAAARLARGGRDGAGRPHRAAWQRGLRRPLGHRRPRTPIAAQLDQGVAVLPADPRRDRVRRADRRRCPTAR